MSQHAVGSGRRISPTVLAVAAARTVRRASRDVVCFVLGVALALAAAITVVSHHPAAKPHAIPLTVAQRVAQAWAASAQEQRDTDFLASYRAMFPGFTADPADVVASAKADCQRLLTGSYVTVEPYAQALSPADPRVSLSAEQAISIYCPSEARAFAALQ